MVLLQLVVDSEAEKKRDKETRSAIAIQKNWRMLKIKWDFQSTVSAARFIQRVYRGHKGRDEFYSRIENENLERQNKFFTEQAKIIQK